MTPSGTKWTFRDVRYSAAIGGRADIFLLRADEVIE